jgi:ubiquinone/menaquinone biosynthesis C-methylase UbiE
MSLGPPLTAGEAAIYESLVVPRYLAAFAVPAVPMLIPSNGAVVAHLGCRTGYPDELIGNHMPGCSISGADSSPAALDLARAKAAYMSGVRTDYVHADGFPTPLRDASFSHSFGLHPMGVRGDYYAVFCEHFRLLTTGGQMVVAMPLRGSFPELYDMLREFALRHDQPHFGEAVDAAAGLRPNPETLVEQIAQAGFDDIDVGVELVTIPFDSGRDFLEDPIARLVVGPDIRSSIPVTDGNVEPAMEYAADAVSKYWSEITFELTVNIGSVSARRLS